MCDDSFHEIPRHTARFLYVAQEIKYRLKTNEGSVVPWSESWGKDVVEKKGRLRGFFIWERVLSHTKIT